MRNKHTHILGVIGGLGPLATAYFLELITKMTDAEKDQDHLEIIIHSKPSIPDRTEYILGKSNENPMQDFIAISKSLASAGAQCIAIPCMTAHYFYDSLSTQSPIPIIHGVRETVRILNDAGYKKVGIMASSGSIYSGVFQRELTQNNMEPIIPDEENQDAVMSMIYNDVKAQGHLPDSTLFHQVGAHLRSRGAQIIVIGCTELSIAKEKLMIGPGYIDALEVLAKASLLFCGKQIKPDYHNLIT